MTIEKTCEYQLPHPSGELSPVVNMCRLRALTRVRKTVLGRQPESHNRTLICAAFEVHSKLWKEAENPKVSSSNCRSLIEAHTDGPGASLRINASTSSTTHCGGLSSCATYDSTGKQKVLKTLVFQYKPRGWPAHTLTAPRIYSLALAKICPFCQDPSRSPNICKKFALAYPPILGSPSSSCG